MKELSFSPDGKKLSCKCYFTKDGFFYISPQCKTHRENLDKGEPFFGVEKEE